MSTKTEDQSQSSADQFAREAEGSSTGLVREFIDFLCHNKKWWLIPIIVVLLIVGVIVVLGSTVAAPFIYTLFRTSPSRGSSSNTLTNSP